MVAAEIGFLVSQLDEDSSYQARIAVVVVVVAATAAAALVIMGCALQLVVAWRIDEEYRSDLVPTIGVAPLPLLVLPVMLDSSGEAV